MFAKVSIPRTRHLLNEGRKIHIHSCPDPFAWYADKVGQIITIEFEDSQGYWGREGGMYNAVNWIAKEDATLLS